MVHGANSDRTRKTRKSERGLDSPGIYILFSAIGPGSTHLRYMVPNSLPGFCSPPARDGIALWLYAMVVL